MNLEHSKFIGDYQCSFRLELSRCLTGHEASVIETVGESGDDKVQESVDFT